MKIEAERTGLIYVITFPNGKNYIGQTTRSIFQRGKEHLKSSSNCTKLKNAFNKYGNEDVVMRVLKDNIPARYLNYWENQFISQYDSIVNGYNIKYNTDVEVPEDCNMEIPYVTPPVKKNPFERYANLEYVPPRKKIEVLLPKPVKKKEEWRFMPKT